MRDLAHAVHEQQPQRWEGTMWRRRSPSRRIDNGRALAVEPKERAHPECERLTFRRSGVTISM